MARLTAIPARHQMLAWDQAKLRPRPLTHAADPRPAQWAADYAALDDPHSVAWLLFVLRRAGAEQQVAGLLARDPAAHAALDNPASVADLLYALREAGAEQHAGTLVDRLPAVGQFALFLEQPGHKMGYRFGREHDGSPAPSWGWSDLN